MSSRVSVVLTTVANEDDARTMAGMLLERRLAACTQHVSIASHFRWDGAIQTESEVLMLIKTASDRVAEAVAAIRENHKYDVPEIISMPVDSALPAYLDWVVAETRRE